ncbi:MAG: circadian clock KaiB family protein [Rubrivivax sp.]
MPSHKPAPTPAAGVAVAEAAPVMLDLFVSGPTPRSALAIVNVRQLCEQYLSGRYRLQIIDLSQSPALAALHQVIAAPTLVCRMPLPERRLIGDMSRAEQLMAGLGFAGPV